MMWGTGLNSRSEPDCHLSGVHRLAEWINAFCWQSGNPSSIPAQTFTIGDFRRDLSYITSTPHTQEQPLPSLLLTQPRTRSSCGSSWQQWQQPSHCPLSHSTPHSQLVQQQLATMVLGLHTYSVGEESSLNLGRGMWGTGLNSPRNQIVTCLVFTG